LCALEAVVDEVVDKCRRSGAKTALDVGSSHSPAQNGQIWPPSDISFAIGQTANWAAKPENMTRRPPRSRNGAEAAQIGNRSPADPGATGPADGV
jgi:hypothetical protein